MRYGMAAAATHTPKGQIKSLKLMAEYLRPYKKQILIAFIALVFTSSAVLGIGQALRFLVDEGLSKRNPELLDRALWIMLLVTALLAVATYTRYYFVSWIGEQVIADMRRKIYAHLIALDVGFFETHRSGDLLSTLTTDTTLLQSLIGSSVSVALRHLIMLVGGIVMLFITSAKLTLCVLLILPLVMVPIITLGKKVRHLSRHSQDRVGDINAHAEETLYGIRTIQSLTLEAQQTRTLSAHVTAALGVALTRIRTRALLTAIVIGLVFGAIVTVLWIGGHDVLANSISAGDLSAFIFFSVIVAGSTGALSEIVGDLQRAAGATERIGELLSTLPAIVPPPSPAVLTVPVKGTIAFHRVTFHYPSRPDKAALSGIALEVKEGETVALVGPSGAGKTTVLQLLLRFYDPQAGHITIDGIPITALAPQELRKHIGLVPQDPVIFSTSAWENIRFGNPEADNAMIMEAARAANALEFLEKLPEGLDTFLGEKGVRLSGGQRQRIAIARAIIRNPRILLLDEATSALDSENEQQVQGAIEKLMQGRTTLVIAHRLSTVLRADRIVVLENGQIEAIGSHKELLTESPLYARLAKLQFAGG